MYSVIEHDAAFCQYVGYKGEIKVGMFSWKGWGLWVGRGGQGRDCSELLGSSAAEDKTVKQRGSSSARKHQTRGSYPAQKHQTGAVIRHKSIRQEAVIWHRSIRLLDDIAALGWQIH